ARLTKAGKMRPAGIAEVERARADGRWDAAYDPPSRAEVPPDLALALTREPKAKAFFTALNSTNRYAILYRIHDAKRPETRARRCGRFVEWGRGGSPPYGGGVPPAGGCRSKSAQPPLTSCGPMRGWNN